MDLDLTGKTALVTGSTAGIGLAIAIGLAEQGAHVWINGRAKKGVAAATQALREKLPGAAVSGVAGDLLTAAGLRALTRAVPAVDILVNNLGAVNARKSFDDLSDAEWQEMFDVNVMTGVRVTRHYLGPMRQREWGRIVFVSSEAALQVPTELIHYAVSKAANIVIARGIAEQLAGTGITVNSVIPGPTMARGLTKRIAESGKSEADYAAEFFRTMRPTSLIRRFTSTEEVANLVVYLCSPAASATHGAALRVEGGILRNAF
jgi:NAD(P)-dependent dehydrogenase (short-subunit alcohol dehydrogenase family)